MTNEKPEFSVEAVCGEGKTVSVMEIMKSFFGVKFGDEEE